MGVLRRAAVSWRREPPLGASLGLLTTEVTEWRMEEQVFESWWR